MEQKKLGLLFQSLTRRKQKKCDSTRWMNKNPLDERGKQYQKVIIILVRWFERGKGIWYKRLSLVRFDSERANDFFYKPFKNYSIMKTNFSA